MATKGEAKSAVGNLLDRYLYLCVKQSWLAWSCLTNQEAFEPMSSKWHVISTLFAIATLAVPAYGANQGRPQAPVVKPPAAAFHSAPAPAFRPPRPAAAPPTRVAYHQPPPAPSARLAFHQPPVRNFQPPHMLFHAASYPSGPRLAVNQHFPRRPLPPTRIGNASGLRGGTAPAHSIPPRPVVPIGARHDGPQGYPPHSSANVLASGRRQGTQRPPRLVCDQRGEHCNRAPQSQFPQPRVVCDSDGDHCRQVASPPQAVCDGDGDNCPVRRADKSRSRLTENVVSLV